MTNAQTIFTLDAVARRIFELRGRQVMLDLDLAALYGVETRSLVQAIKRNLARFPEDFMFQLSKAEWSTIKSHFTLPSLWGGRHATPYAFTKHGAFILSSVFNSSWTDDISLLIIQAFDWLRQAIPGHKELAATMAELENAKQSLRLYSSLLSRQITNSAKLIFKS